MSHSVEKKWFHSFSHTEERFSLFFSKICLAERTIGTHRPIHSASLSYSSSCYSCSCSAPPSPSSTTSAAPPPPPHPPATAAATCYAAIDGLSGSSSSRSRMTFAQLDQTSSRGRFASTLQCRPSSNSGF